ncbi:hypothetical protein [Mycetocola saprophilus]|uniref:hypothetical protein n=1 Tax=Mycetocola saprophilus TaxID=76636 RepID=UPI0012DE7414|nr:hypothetical protein [Mycetocola saprophilus]
MKRVFRLLAAFVDALSASFEKFAAEARENTKKYPDREYWRGYYDGAHDARGTHE